MTTYNLISKKGKKYSINLPPSCDQLPSAYLFAFYKSGSTLMNNMITTYCHKIDRPVFSLFDSAFMQGISTHDIQADAAQCISRNGYIYTGFRHFPAFELDLKRLTTVLLVRDPRDMVVSAYYSARSSHIIPRGLEIMKKNRLEAAALDINEFALKRQRVFVNAFQQYRASLSDSNLTIYRYEDVIYEKEKWMNQLVDKLCLEKRPEILASVTRQFDVFPEAEEERQHIRQVHPGNYKEKLSEQCIEELNESLNEFLKFFNYEI